MWESRILLSHVSFLFREAGTFVPRWRKTCLSWDKFVIPIEYRNNTKIPTYIEIACAASRYGDYFTGGLGSVLKIDEFELVYDPAELTETQRALVNYR